MGEKYLGQLTAKSAPATGDIMVLEDSEDTKKIDYDALANAILNKLTTKTYTVAGGSNTLIAAIDALNSKTNGTLLWSGSTTLDGGTITLSSPVTNFTWLLFVFKTNNEIATCIMKADHATTERPYAIIQAGEWVTDANRFRYCAWCSLTKTSDTTYDVTCKYNNQNFICKPGAVWGF